MGFRVSYGLHMASSAPQIVLKLGYCRLLSSPKRYGGCKNQETSGFVHDSELGLCCLGDSESIASQSGSYISHPFAFYCSIQRIHRLISEASLKERPLQPPETPVGPNRPTGSPKWAPNGPLRGLTPVQPWSDLVSSL